MSRRILDVSNLVEAIENGMISRSEERRVGKEC